MHAVCDGRETSEVLGWFDWEPLYDRAVETAPPGSTLVEVGVFCGKSLIYLARKARDADKGLRVIGVDTFQGSPEFDGRVFFNDRPFSQAPSGALVSLCVSALTEHGVRDDVILLMTDSLQAARLFNNASLHMVFVDADHTEEAVVDDILSWCPKVAPGGILAGHDYWDFPGVKSAVDRLIPDAVTHPEQTWWEKAC